MQKSDVFFFYFLLTLHLSCGSETNSTPAINKTTQMQFNANTTMLFATNESKLGTQISTEAPRHRLKEKLSGGPIGYDGSPVFLFTPRDPLLPPNGKVAYCRIPAICEPLNFTTCMGVKLPYSSTTLKLVGDSSTQEQVQEKLQLWQGLRHIPKCWAVIQPFLCAVYMPKCENEEVDLPSQEMCKMTMGPCRILYTDKNFPSFLKCDDITRFPPMCKNDVRELRFNTTAKCQAPLVPTDNAHAFYEGVDGCGVQCHDPLFTLDEHRQIHQMIAWGGTISLLFNLFTVMTFYIDWRSANKYPPLVIFYMNVCFLVSCIGWLVQFLPGARDDIVCRKDGTLRMSEPSAGENLSCVVVFVLVYYFLIAGLVWFVILTYTWHLSFQALGKIHDSVDKKGAYYHLAAWSLPLVLTITTMALGEIDGNSMSGVCFVGYVNQPIRAGFLLGPIMAMVLVGGYFFSRGLITLVKLKINSQEIISEKASAKIRETIFRIGLFSLMTFIFVLATFACHIYEFKHHQEWKESFRKYIVCRITRSGSHTDDMLNCKLDSRPSVAMLQLHLLMLFSAGVAVSSWVWTGATVDAWKRWARRKFRSEPDAPVKLKKHKVIARAFAKRKTFNNAGRMSISFHSTHEDPVGLNFDMNSLASQDFSSTWAAALPKLMTRRGALIGVTTGSVSSQRSQRRNSMDSEFSYSVRRVSVESRRHSLDSQVSVHIAELTATRKSAATPIPSGGGGGRRRHRRRRRTFGHNRTSRVGPLFNRRGSSTSQESQLGAQVNEILTALTIGNTNMSSLMPNLTKRRSGNAGLDGKLALPFMLPRQSLEISDEENSGDKVHEPLEKMNVIRCGQGAEVELYDGHVSDEPDFISKLIEESRDTKQGKRKSRGVKAISDVVRVSSRTRDDGGERKSKNGHFDGSKVVKNSVTESVNAKKDSVGRANKPLDLRKNKGTESTRERTYDTDEEEEEVFCKPSSDDAEVSDGSTSFCPELSRLAVLSSHSGVSVGTQHDFPRDSRAREIGTQTSTSMEDVTIDEFGDKVEYVKPTPSRRSNQSTRVSPQFGTKTPARKTSEKSTKPYHFGGDSVSNPLKDLRSSYGAYKHVQELSESRNSAPPSRPQRRKGSQGNLTDIIKSKSADISNIV